MPFGTGAGKGPLPRHVDGDKYREGYERAFGKNAEAKNEKEDKPDEDHTTVVQEEK